MVAEFFTFPSAFNLLPFFVVVVVVIIKIFEENLESLQYVVGKKRGEFL